MKFNVYLITLFLVVTNSSFAQMSPSNTKESLTFNQSPGSQGPKGQDWKPIKTGVPKGGNGPHKGLAGNGYVSRENNVTNSAEFYKFLQNPIKMGKLEVTRSTTILNGYNIDKYLAMTGGGWRIPTWADMEIIASNSTLHPDLHQGEPYRTLQYSDVNRSYIKFYQRCCFITVGFIMFDNGNTINIDYQSDRYFYETMMLTILVRDAK